MAIAFTQLYFIRMSYEAHRGLGDKPLLDSLSLSVSWSESFPVTPSNSDGSKKPPKIITKSESNEYYYQIHFLQGRCHNGVSTIKSAGGTAKINDPVAFTALLVPTLPKIKSGWFLAPLGMWLILNI